jgi:hypothetical protein
VTAQRQVPVHYLRGNETAWTPPQVIYLDTETRWHEGPEGQTHVMRLWAARLDSRRPDSTRWVGSVASHGHTAAQLAARVDSWCRGQRCVWLFAHNLSFDLTVAALPAQLAALGWEVTDHAAGSETPWLRMAAGDCTLTMADSWGWLRQPVGALGAALGLPKPDLPGNGDAESAWLVRCEADRDILAAAMGQVLDWWDDRELGHWSVTGSHSGWNVMRHIAPRKRMTIIPSDEGIAADRAAIYGGRRECFTWGDIGGGPFTEYDFTAAYPTIAAYLPLPAKRLYSFDSLPLDHGLVRGAGFGIIAQVDLETDTPRWPCRAGGRVWYPVGRFTTTLAGPEIAEAHRLGCLRAVGPGHAHALGWYLKPWAEWVLAIQHGEDTAVPPVAVPMVKHWGRAVIGKFAAHGFTKQPYGDATGPGWSYEPVWDIGAQAHGAIVQLGGKRWKCLATASGENCYPAVLAYVESHTRARLSRAVEAIGREHAVSCDTDGLLARDGQHWARVVDQAGVWPLVMRAKKTCRVLRVIGPQHLVKDGKRSYSGVPGSAEVQADGSLTAMVWPKLSWQLREHQGEGYRRPVQTYVIGASYAPGWIGDDATVLPPEMATGPGGGSCPVPWPQTRHAASGRVLGPVQSPAVERVFGR